MVGVFFGVYGLILSDRFHKPSAAVLGATLMVGTGVLSETDLVSAINWTALGVPPDSNPGNSFQEHTSRFFSCGK